MKDWSKAEEEKALMDLEIMYLKSNQNPKLYELIMNNKKNVDKSGKMALKKPKKEKKKQNIGK